MITALLVGAAGCGGYVMPPGTQGTTSTATSVTSRIIGGSVVGTFPGVGQLGGCTGTLITPTKVLTAGHCVAGHEPDEFTFLIGQDTSNPTYSLPVASFVVAPGYDTALDNDLALVTLGIEAPVPTIPLINSIDSSWVGRNLTFVGYGDSSGQSRSGSGVARDASIPIGQVEPKLITFGGSTSNVCFGDSGGPSFYQDAAGNMLLVSVTSYTTTTDCTGPSGATRVDAYLSFIGEPGQAPVMGSTSTGGGTTTGGTTTQSGTSSNSCGTETTTGRCSGDTVIWCSNGQVEEQDCATAGGHCSWSYLNQVYACATGPAPTSDPCNGETFEGRCDDNVSIWCYDNNTVVKDNCTAVNKTCGFNVALGYFDCLTAQQ